MHRYSYWNASAALGAVGAVGEHAAAPKSLIYQVGVRCFRDEMARAGYLRSGQPIGEVAAVVRSCVVKLDDAQGKVVGVSHADARVMPRVFQYIESNVQGGDAALTAVSSHRIKCSRGIGAPPMNARWGVSCWQSMISMECVRHHATNAARAVFDALDSRANMDSPNTAFPMHTQ